MSVGLLHLVNGSVLVLLATGYYYFMRIKKSSTYVVTGEAEDNLLDKQYQRAIIVSAVINGAFILSLSAMAIGFIMVRERAPAIPLLSFTLLVISVLSTAIVMKSTALANPSRPIPNWTQEDAVFEAMDEGERYIALKAYYKVYKVLTCLLLASILIAMYYSVLTEHSQIISIMLMTVLLLVMSGSYLAVLRREQ